MEDVGLVLAGAAGALVPELVRLAKGPVNGVFGQPGYWVQLLAQLLLGAIAAALLDPEGLTEAASLGFAAPQLLTRALAAKTPTPPVSPPDGGGAPRFDFPTWWSR